MAENTKTRILSPKEQGREILYEMELKFRLDIELTGINDIMSGFGFTEKAGLKDAVTVSMKQVTPFIPDDETINEYSKIIKENFLKEHKDFSISACKFCGYGYLYAITVEE